MLKEAGAAIGALVDLSCQEIYHSDAPRQHLGASIIGEECARKIWYSFRWATHGVYTGKQYRLFNTGHKEEIRFVEWFRSIGFEVSELDESTSQQHRISAVGGHFGGSLDSKACYRGGYGPKELQALISFLLNVNVLLEFKTHNKVNFAKLKNHGVILAFPKHYTQMSTYGTFYGMQYCIYAGYCKDDDSLYFEVVKPDHNICNDMLRKAEEVITQQTPPRKAGLDSSFWMCKKCTYAEICHNNQPMMLNCRSCRHAIAQDNKAWFCNHWKGFIPEDRQIEGCQMWAQLDNK
ncbi:MAG TPA: hypothetical protein PK745_00205 [bacterium]|nr:hypothetical protein [bacterium]